MTESPWKNRFGILKQNGLDRQMRTLAGPHGPTMMSAGASKLVFCSNDYLGLASAPTMIEALHEGVDIYGVGAAGSRLVSGNTAAHDILEKKLGAFCKKKAAVVFPSGYQANVGAISALTRQGDQIFSDRLVHASLIDGCRLSKAQVHIFEHKNTNHLGQLLSETSTGPGGLKLIITDSVFSMDGDEAPLMEICRLAKAHNAKVYLDEAHALGVMGPEGRGLAAKLGLLDDIHLYVGTMGKAMGISGAFVACDEFAANLLKSTARSLLYTTACPGAIAYAAGRSLTLLKTAEDGRRQLSHNIAYFKEKAEEAKIELMPSNTAIQPIIIGDEHMAVQVSAALWATGIFVQAIRPPTVPPGTSRLRVTLTASHTEKEIDTLIAALCAILKNMELL